MQLPYMVHNSLSRFLDQDGNVLREVLNGGFWTKRIGNVYMNE